MKNRNGSLEGRLDLHVFAGAFVISPMTRLALFTTVGSRLALRALARCWLIGHCASGGDTGGHDEAVADV